MGRRNHASTELDNILMTESQRSRQGPPTFSRHYPPDNITLWLLFYLWNPRSYNKLMSFSMRYELSHSRSTEKMTRFS